MIENDSSSTPKGSIIAIHQPNYFPWLGYFNKIFCSDVFIFHDNVKFTKRSFTKRTLIRASKTTERKYLTVPLKKHSDYSLIKDLKIDNTKNWQIKHLNQLKGIYQKSPYFKVYYPQVYEIFEGFRDFETLVDVNVHSIKGLMEMLSIKIETPISSKLQVIGTKSDYNINLVKLFKGTTYLSGTGARKYQAEEEFVNVGIKLIYQEMRDFIEKNPYYQAQGNFVNGLSVLDALFNIGVDGIIEILEKYRTLLFSNLDHKKRI